MAKTKKIITPGRVVVVLNGRFAGHKAIVVAVNETGNREREFGHALVAGIDRSPRSVTKSMSKTKIIKRSKVKPFVKYVNFTHILPTRYTVDDFQLDKLVNDEKIKKADSRKESRQAIRKVFEDKYLNRQTTKMGVAFFFSKLRF